MKFTSIFASALALVPTVFGQKFVMHVTYSDALVDVGDTDLFGAIWHSMYRVADDRGGLSDITRSQTTRGCYGAQTGSNVRVRVLLDGQWGAVRGVNGWQMRDALIGTMWRTSQELYGREAYNVYRGCRGFTWQEGVNTKPDIACGPRARTQCPNDNIGGCRGVPQLSCERHSTGHRMPSVVRINVYTTGNQLRADNFRADYSAQSQAFGRGGCGKAGAIAEVLLSFIPGVGTYFEKGVKIACRTGGVI